MNFVPWRFGLRRWFSGRPSLDRLYETGNSEPIVERVRRRADQSSLSDHVARAVMLNPGISLRELQDAFPEIAHVFVSSAPTAGVEDATVLSEASLPIGERN